MFTAISLNSVTLSGTVPELGKISKNFLVAKVVVVLQAVVVEMWFRVVVVTVGGCGTARWCRRRWDCGKG